MDNRSPSSSLSDGRDPLSIVQDNTQKSVSVAALVLAAGSSRRMGPQNKLLTDIQGASMIRHVVNRVNASSVAATMVVTGHESERVGRSLDGCPVRLVHNPDHEQGLSVSLRRGLSVLQDFDGVLVLLGDMPHVSTEVVDKMVKRFCADSSRPIVAPFFQGKRGNPVLWPRRFFNEMQQISGDQGAKELLDKYPYIVHEMEVDDSGVLVDIDTPDDLDGLTVG